MYGPEISIKTGIEMQRHLQVELHVAGYKARVQQFPIENPIYFTYTLFD